MNFFDHNETQQQQSFFNFSEEKEILQDIFQIPDSQVEMEEDNSTINQEVYQLYVQEKIQQEQSESKKNLVEKTMNVILYQEANDQSEYLPNLKVSVNQNNEIYLSQLILQLKCQGFYLEKAMIFYQLTEKMFFYCGNDPLPEDLKVPLQYELTIKYRFPCKKHPPLLMQQQKGFQQQYNQPDFQNSNKSQIQNNKRIKERLIGEVYQKVQTWRNLYSVKNISLENAAIIVGISKKTLDDYLLQIRLGQRYGFDFNQHFYDKIGILRNFVKQKKQRDKHSSRNYRSKFEIDHALQDISPTLQKQQIKMDYKADSEEDSLFSRFLQDQTDINIFDQCIQSSKMCIDLTEVKE